MPFLDTPCAQQEDPPHTCMRCPRLSSFIELWRKREPTWFNAPVPTFLPPQGRSHVQLLIVGLAPGLRGANRTGRPFTGDFAGNLLYETLLKFGLAKGKFEARADDTLLLVNTAITNAVRCVPPENKPIGTEIKNCQNFLFNTIKSFPNLKLIVTLGAVAHRSTIRALGGRASSYPFKHGDCTRISDFSVISSYHCSRYNTNTRRLTEESFMNIFSHVGLLLKTL